MANAVTDASRKFRIDGVPDGTYFMLWRAEGFVTHRSDPFSVSGTMPTKIASKLRPCGKITGRVTFGENVPVSGTGVELYGITRRSTTSTTTDSDGRYEFSDIIPGIYQLGARPSAAMPQPASNEDGEKLAWLLTFVPNVVERQDAERISVRAGSEQMIDIPLRAMPVRSVRGIVHDDSGRPVSGATIKLESQDVWVGTQTGVTSGPDGGWEMPAVPDGDWRVHAEIGDRRGFAPLRVNHRNIEGIRIRLEAPFTASGFVDREDPRDAKGGRPVSGIFLIPADGLSDRLASVFHQQDGFFAIKGVQPGRYRIRPIGDVPGFYVAAVLLGDRDVTTSEVDLFPGAPPIRIVYRPNPGRVSGTVEKGDGATVVLVPRDEALLDTQFIRSAQVLSGGRFDVIDLRPGSYYAFAFNRIEWDMLESVDFVRRIAPQAESVDVSHGQTANVDLKVQRWPEY